MEKLKVIRNTNPHAVPDLDFYVSTFPLICYPENVNYLVFSFTENQTENGRCEDF